VSTLELPPNRVVVAGAAQPRVIPRISTGGDRAYRGIATASGVGVLGVLCLIGLFLSIQAYPAIKFMGWRFFTYTGWITQGAHPAFGVGGLVYWTVVIAVIALVVAIPLSLATALFITEYAPRRARAVLITVVDLLAVVPSIIYGLWGFFVLQPSFVGFAHWLSTHMAFVPIFRVQQGAQLTSSAAIAGVVVGIMITPIITSISRELFSLAPVGEREGALALGATRSQMIRTVVLPFGRGGMIGAIMLAFGRALGETIAVAIIISPIYTIDPHILQAGANSIAALIALFFGSGGPLGEHAQLAAGLVLFFLTLVVNLLASIIVNRSRSGKGVEL